MSTEAPHIPGYAKRKLLLALAGFLLLFFGLSELSTTLRLLIFGRSVTAEAVQVIKTRPGMEDMVLRDEPSLIREETEDRSYTFWNEFSFWTKEGSDVIVRLPVGSQLRSLYPLRDQDGLPSALFVRYDPASPDVVAFPTVLGVWFVPGVFVVAGLMAMASGLMLFRQAKHKIDRD